MAAENKFIRCGFPAFFFRFGAIVTESVLDLSRSLINLRTGETALDAPLDRFGAARGDPDRRMRLLHRARPDRTVFELEELSFETPHRFSPGGHNQVIGFLKSSARLF